MDVCVSLSDIALCWFPYYLSSFHSLDSFVLVGLLLGFVLVNLNTPLQNYSFPYADLNKKKVSFSSEIHNVLNLSGSLLSSVIWFFSVANLCRATSEEISKYHIGIPINISPAVFSANSLATNSQRRFEFSAQSTVWKGLCNVDCPRHRTCVRFLSIRSSTLTRWPSCFGTCAKVRGRSSKATLACKDSVPILTKWWRCESIPPLNYSWSSCFASLFKTCSL